MTVVLSGEGADELFAGYETHIANKAARFADWLPGPFKRATGFLFERIPSTDKRKTISTWPKIL